jgi:hypothetical protein
MSSAPELQHLDRVYASVGGKDAYPEGAVRHGSHPGEAAIRPHGMSKIDFGPIDYVKFAEAFGATGLMIDKPDDIALKHGDGVPHHLLDRHPYNVSTCRRVFRLPSRDVDGSRHRLRLQGNPSPEPVCRHRSPNSDVRQPTLRAIGSVVLALLGRRDDIITKGIATAVVTVVAAMSPADAWQQPLQRLGHTMVGVAVGVASKRVGSFLSYKHIGEQAP